MPRWITWLLAVYCLARLCVGGYTWVTRETTVTRLTEDWYQVSRVDKAGEWLITREGPQGREQARVRLIAVREPDDREGQLQFEAARRLGQHWAADRWLGARVRIELGRRQIDRDGVFLVTAWDGDLTVQEILVGGGWLVPDAHPSNLPSLARRLRQATDAARAAGRGVWAGQLVAQRPL